MICLLRMHSGLALVKLSSTIYVLVLLRWSNRNAIFIDYSILNVRLLEFILNWYHNIEKAIYLCQLFIFRLSVFI